tara:strand:+ start:293 stop:1930 length:1638 start_codon:yes stop_codon:yes gene_type:complete
MADVNLGIGIGAEYKGRAAFQKADKDILGLQAGVKSLAKAYIGLAGAQKAFRYATASIKAFAQDDAAVKTLSKTLDNLGLAYEQTNVENFIAGLESTFHVADDLLRPAFAKLVQVTQSYTKSKELLTVALNASAGAGVDLSTTISDLSAAYVGNLKGLKKYNLGLTNAELATKSFAEIQALLNKTFSGQASLAADTYARKLDALTIASGNAQEIIGRGLVDAISAAFGGGDIEKATKNIEAMAGGVAEIVRGLGDVARLSGFSLLSNVFGALADKRNALATKDRKFDPRTGNMPDLTPAGMKIIMARKKADAEAAKRQKELAALAGKQTKAIKEQTALAKAKAILDKSNMIFNMDLIQNTAALQGKVTENETLRLKVQREILLGNSKAAADLAQELLSVQLAAVIAGNVDPFGKLKDSVLDAINSIKQLRDELALLGSPKVKTPAQLLAEDYQSALISIADPSFDLQTQAVNDFLNSLNAPSPTATMPNYLDDFTRRNPTTGAMNIVVSIDPSAAQYGIGVASVNNSANGNNNNYSTIQSFAGGL